ncbi:MAG: hypothetical protein IT431_04415 [Phycisphaerales bacterium]|nr:hypothetical protein [Phycisphaerales bacterium]
MPRTAGAISAAVALLLLAAYACWPHAALWVHFGVAQVCHGTSGGKIGYLLLVVAAAGARVALAKPDQGPGWLRAFVIATAVGLVSTGLSFALYSVEFGIPTGRSSYHWAGGVNSVNTLSHMHTGKAGLALLLDALGPDSLHARFDTGLVYLGVVPRWLAVIILLSFFASLTCGIAALPRLTRANHPGRFLIAALCVAWLSKCILDGGPLAYDAVAGAVGIALLGAESSRTSAVAVRATLAVGLWMVALFALDPGAAAGQFGRAASKLGLLALLGFRPGARGPRLLAALGAAAFGLSVWLEVSRVLLPLLGPAPADLVVCNTPRLERAAPGESRLHAYRRFGDNPLRVRLVSLGERSGARTGLMAELIIVRAAERGVRFVHTAQVRLVRLEPVDDDRARLRLEAAFDPSLGPVMYDGSPDEDDQIDANERFLAYAALDRLLRDSGVEEYILLPYVQYADTP